MAQANSPTHHSTHWGSHLIESDGRKITAVLDHPSDPDPSPLGQGLRAATNCRVAKPAVRASWLDHGPGSNTHLRGKEPFVEVDWDTATALVSAELDRVSTQHGTDSIYAGSYGWGSAGLVHHPSNQTSRFFRQFSQTKEGPAYTDGRLTYSSAAAAAIVPYIFGLSWYPACGQQTAWSVVAESTELFVSFGSLRVNNTQVHFGGQGPHHTRAWVEEAAKQGVEFVNIGPVGDDEADEAKARWLPIRPSTDVALMAALAHTVLTDGAAAEGFLASHCVGWDRLKPYLLGQTDGQPKSAAWAAEITGIGVDAIVDLAREMQEKRTLINLSFSIQRTDHGEQSYWMATALAAVLGQIGLPGGGAAFPFGAHGRTGAGRRPLQLARFPVPAAPDDQTIISVSRVADLLENPGRPFQFDGVDGVFPDTKLVYWIGGNVFHHHQDLNRLLGLWQRPETIVVHEPFWNPMSKHADIVLPATTALERNDLGDAEEMLIANRAAIEPFGQARNDYDILAGLAQELGFGDAFTEGRSGDEWVRHLYEQFRSQHDHAPAFETFWEDGVLPHPLASFGDTEHVFLGAFRDDQEAAPLPTPSGKIELFSETIDGFGYDDCLGHPAWFEPYERLGTEAAQKHPLHLVSNQPTTRLHSQFDHSDLSRGRKIDGREPARVHSEEASSRGLHEGDVIRLFNDRGACLAGLIVDDAVAPGIVQLATGAWFDPDGDGTCKHGNPNVLTRDKGTSKLGQGPSAHTCLVQMEALEGTPPPVTAFDPPQFR